jgi:hypothetical protein
MSFKSKFCTILFSVFAISVSAQTFMHPGLLNCNADISRIKNALSVGQPDIRAGYEQLRQQPQSLYTYQMKGPMEMVGRNPTIGQTAYDSDATAAFQNALMWAISGDIRHAKKAIEIVNAWSATLKMITGKDAVLMAGLGPFKMVNAAELLRYTASGWAEADIRRTELHFKTVIYPITRNFAPFANGNWDSAALKTNIAIAIFCNDRALFENALVYYQEGGGDGSLTNYIINQTGQCQESGRDQSHTQLGIAHLADCCEMAWHQGIDLYALHDNLLLKGFEYTAKFNLGKDVLFTPTIDRTGKYRHNYISEEGRGRLRPIYEEVYNHYAIRRGLEAPYSAEAASRIRPEGEGSQGADHAGFGTLMFSRTEKDPIRAVAPSQPSGILAQNRPPAIFLEWPAVLNAKFYSVYRSSSSSGPYRKIAPQINLHQYADHSVRSGMLYHYRIRAFNDHGQSGFSEVKTISAGLPRTWEITDIGIGPDTLSSSDLFSTGRKHGTAIFDGHNFNITGIGSGWATTPGRATYLYRRLGNIRTMVIKYVPQLSSQSTEFGLSINRTISPASPRLAILIRPVAASNVEAPAWMLQCIKSNGADTLEASAKLDTLAVNFGRLTGPIWLKFSRNGNCFRASYSFDQKNWISLAKTRFMADHNTLAGITVASGSNLIDTRITIADVNMTLQTPRKAYSR